jgi:hypothetical protein
MQYGHISGGVLRRPVHRRHYLGRWLRKSARFRIRRHVRRRASHCHHTIFPLSERVPLTVSTAHFRFAL